MFIYSDGKERVTDIKELKKKLEEFRREAETAEAKADLAKAAEIRYGKNSCFGERSRYKVKTTKETTKF